MAWERSVGGHNDADTFSLHHGLRPLDPSQLQHLHMLHAEQECCAPARWLPLQGAPSPSLGITPIPLTVSNLAQ